MTNITLAILIGAFTGLLILLYGIHKARLVYVLLGLTTTYYFINLLITQGLI